MQTNIVSPLLLTKPPLQRATDKEDAMGTSLAAWVSGLSTPRSTGIPGVGVVGLVAGVVLGLRRWMKIDKGILWYEEYRTLLQTLF